MTDDSGDMEIIQAPSIPRTAYLLVGIVVVLLILIMVGGFWYIQDQHDKQQSENFIRDRQACIAELNSDVIVAFGDAFGTAPAPGNARASAVKEIHTRAEILKHAGEICTPSLNQQVYDKVEAKAQSGS